MKLTEKFRKYWHDTYYFFASSRGVRFAMTCKDVAEQVDVGIKKTVMGRFKFFLHISLCQGCKNYLILTNELRRAIRSLVSKNEKPGRLNQLNTELVRKHSRGKPQEK